MEVMTKHKLQNSQEYEALHAQQDRNKAHCTCLKDSPKQGKAQMWH